MRESLRQEIVEIQSSRSGKDADTIENDCKNTLSTFYDIKDHLTEIGCNIE
jgi:hypothetical protein